jgi:hypothetical protein
MCQDSSVRGFTYIGQVDRTAKGVLCQLWDTFDPHDHPQDDSRFLDGDMWEAKNYCRNPDGELMPWCYTTDPNLRWDFCDVIPCGELINKIKLIWARKKYRKLYLKYQTTVKQKSWSSIEFPKLATLTTL